jgi:hypothetical protein
METEMPRPNSIYTAEQVARRGQEIYDSRLREILEPHLKGRIVSIDIETGEYAVGKTGLAAGTQLLAAKPHAELFCIRIGYPTLRKFGPRQRRRLD